ncbi:MAG: hypothetical protein IJ844_00240 [Prevotella sp.]|nr:hypothetical protein [Prevotella sp.]
MEKMTKQLFVAAVALSAFTACSESNLAELDSVVVDPQTAIVSENSAVLTDASGQQVSTLSPDFGTYYLDIKTDGGWKIEIPDNMEFTPTKMFGRGNTRVPVLIGNNWAEARTLSYKVKVLDENGDPISNVTRAGEGGDGTQTVIQASSTNLANFSKIVNSNIFVGYGFNPTKNSVPELCTGIMVFDMDSLINTVHVKNSLSPSSKQYYYYAHSDSVIDKVIAVNGHFGGNFNVVKLGLNLNNFNKTNKENYESTTIQKSMTRTVYSREINFANIQNDENILSAGFKYYKQRFVSQFNATGATDADKNKAAEDFIAVVGSHFISKALLGNELDYRMEFSSTKVKKILDVKAALDFKWTQQVKDTAKVDSTLQQQLKEKKDSAKNFFINGDVQYTDSTFDAATSTTASVKARGGDVELVNILTTGGSLLNTQLAAWMLGTEPEKATMTYMEVQPIYMLFQKDDEKAIYDFLRKLIEEKYDMTPVVGDFGKLD